jgi:hypothetical protein
LSPSGGRVPDRSVPAGRRIGEAVDEGLRRPLVETE